MTPAKAMNEKQRIEAVIAGKQPDYTPVVGGWIACPEHICNICEITLDEYWKNPEPITAEAYRRLGTDGLVWLFVPATQEDYRCVDASSFSSATKDRTLEETLEYIDSMPEPERYESDFDYEAEYAKFKAELQKYQQMCDPVLWMPAQWFAGSKISWYQDIGYENFFMLIGLYEKHFRKLLEIGHVTGRQNCELVARAVKEGLYPKAMFFGEDVCTQRGPMVDPDYLEKYWAPLLADSMKPLLEVGCRPIWHCDGDVRPILDMLLDCGIGGFQGFQPECGMTIEYVSRMRTKDGGKLLLLGPLSVTGELPVMTPKQVKAKVRDSIDCCKGNADLLLFTANTINPDVPLENIRAMYEGRL